MSSSRSTLKKHGIKIKFKNKDMQKVWDKFEKIGGGELERAITEYKRCVLDLIMFGECVTKDRDVARMLRKQF